MKTNSKKKRIAFSTQVMTLVAILAIATMTISWFTLNRTADADGINVKSVQSAYLQISEDGESWSSEINYLNDDPDKFRSSNLTQVSSAFDGASLGNPVFWQGYASLDNSYQADSSGFTQVPYQTESGYVNVYDLYAKIADEKVYNLMVKVDGRIIDGGNYGRIAIVRQPNNTFSETSPSMKLYYMAEDSNQVYLIDSHGNYTENYPITPVHNNFVDISLGRISSSPTHFKIYVWNEGQDYDCTTNNLDKIFSFNLDLYLKEVEPVEDGESFIKVFGT